MSNVEIIDQPAPIDTAGLSISELAVLANEEHRACIDALSAGLVHAVKCGEVLLAARQQATAYGDWYQWLEQNFDGDPSTASTYMRLGHYRDVVLSRPWQSEGLKAGAKKSEISRAVTYLRGLPGPEKYSGVHHPEATKREARRLRESGASYTEIAQTLSISKTTAANWCDSKRAAKHRAASLKGRQRRSAERKAAKQAERDRAIRKVKGPGSEAYSLVRRAAQMLERASSESQSVSAKASYNSAQRRLMKVEDEIVQALGVE
jgi:predicted transcriptional regulator